MDLGIERKAAIVTGGSRGMRREAARALLRAGARVAICARGKDALMQTRDELGRETGGDVIAVICDASVEADIERLVADAVAHFGGVDILVNNAGTMYSGRFERLTDTG